MEDESGSMLCESADPDPYSFLTDQAAQLQAWHRGRLRGSLLMRWKNGAHSHLPDAERRALEFLRVIHVDTPGSLRSWLATVRTHKSSCDFLASELFPAFVFDPQVGEKNVFLVACRENQLNLLRWLWQHYSGELGAWADTPYEARQDPCAWGDFPPARPLDGACTYGEKSFQEACHNASLTLVKWVQQVFPNTNVYANHNLAFWNACVRHDKGIAQWLFQTFQSVQVHAGFDFGFRVLCQHGDLDTIQWLLEKHPDIDVHCMQDEAFRLTCQNGHLDVVQWMAATFPDLNPHAKREYAFRAACHRGHLAVAQALLQLFPGIDVLAENKHAFRGGHPHVNHWLASLERKTRQKKRAVWFCWR